MGTENLGVKQLIKGDKMVTTSINNYFKKCAYEQKGKKNRVVGTGGLGLSGNSSIR